MRIPQAATSSALEAPISMNSDSVSITCLRSPSGSKWGGRVPICPGIRRPSRVCTSTRWLGRVWFHHPPSGTIRRKPSGVIPCTMKPISSMWASKATTGPSSHPFSWQIRLPATVSVISQQSCNSSAIRARTSPSNPETPAALLQRSNKSLFSMPLLYTARLAGSSRYNRNPR